MAGMSALVSARVIQVLPMTMVNSVSEGVRVVAPASSRSQRGQDMKVRPRPGT
jgi:hypothetical protein